jgi:hypothetical protein
MLRRRVARALVTTFTVLALTTAALGVSAPPASAGICSPYLSVRSPLFGYTSGSREPAAWGQVLLESNGSPCLGHHTIDVWVDAKPRYRPGSWGGFGLRRYIRLPASELGAMLESGPVERRCDYQYRSRYVLDGRLTVTGVPRNGC